MRAFSIFAMICCLSAASAPVYAIVIWQSDDFQDGTVMGWTEGALSPNPPTNVSNGGPAGTGDSYLDNVSAGGVGPGSRMVMFNLSQWAGDYTAAGVDGITMDLANFGSGPLSIRIAVGDVGGQLGTWYASTDPFALPPDGAWYSAFFGLGATDLSFVQGTETLSSVLSAVKSLRILSAAAGPSRNGDAVAARLGVDNITAVPEPLPGDANRDGFINEDDAAILATNWQILSGAIWDMGDFNGDNAVNDVDATILAANWQVGVPAEAAVPEPGTLTMLAIGGLTSLMGFGLRRSRCAN